ncbi:MAG TPA: iron chelate uptake ABC transporter family permease subunit [Planctomycetota bacterium]|nr:iron chelate uptake ABC transporter family permease subunit [Planctomycetota bacterium]
MIEEFVRSWHLFHDTYIVGWLIVVLLAVVGVLVVARDQIFLGAAISEASTLGIAAGMWLAAAGPFGEAAWMESDAFLSFLACAFSVLAALLTARGSESGAESQEALTGWVFLAAGSLSILIVAHSPHGLEEVHRLLFSSIIGASTTDVRVFAALTAILAGGVLWFRRRILLVVTDPDMARALGIRTRAWNLAMYSGLGIAVGLSLRVSGLLYTFGCLVLPPLAARNVCRSALAVFVVSPIIGLVTAMAAFVLANHYDQPPGQMAVALLSGAVAASAAWRRLFPRP